MTNELPSDLLSLAYRPDLGMLVGRWGYQPHPDLLPAAYEQLRQTALECGSLIWLQDIRRRTLNDPATTQWLLAEYFPRVARELGGRLIIAYLTSPTLMDLITNSPSYLLPAGYAEMPFGVAFFSDEGEAVAWLRSQRHATQASSNGR